MLLILLLLIPLIGIFMISTVSYGSKVEGYSLATLKQIKIIGLSTSIINFFVSLVVFILFNFSVFFWSVLVFLGQFCTHHRFLGFFLFFFFFYFFRFPFDLSPFGILI